MVNITVNLTDECLAELQKGLGTTEASTRVNSAGHAFIISSKSITKTPGYNEVEILLPLDGEELLMDLGYLDGLD